MANTSATTSSASAAPTRRREARRIDSARAPPGRVHPCLPGVERCRGGPAATKRWPRPTRPPSSRTLRDPRESMPIVCGRRHTQPQDRPGRQRSTSSQILKTRVHAEALYATWLADHGDLPGGTAVLSGAAKHVTNTEDPRTPPFAVTPARLAVRNAAAQLRSAGGSLDLFHWVTTDIDEQILEAIRGHAAARRALDPGAWPRRNSAQLPLGCSSTLARSPPAPYHTFRIR